MGFDRKMPDELEKSYHFIDFGLFFEQNYAVICLLIMFCKQWTTTKADGGQLADLLKIQVDAGVLFCSIHPIEFGSMCLLNGFRYDIFHYTKKVIWIWFQMKK